MDEFDLYLSEDSDIYDSERTVSESEEPYRLQIDIRESDDSDAEEKNLQSNETVTAVEYLLNGTPPNISQTIVPSVRKRKCRKRKRVIDEYDVDELEDRTDDEEWRPNHNTNNKNKKTNDVHPPKKKRKKMNEKNRKKKNEKKRNSNTKPLCVDDNDKKDFMATVKAHIAKAESRNSYSGFFELKQNLISSFRTIEKQFDHFGPKETWNEESIAILKAFNTKKASQISNQEASRVSMKLLDHDDRKIRTKKAIVNKYKNINK